jgi:hypothetical protein
MQLCALETNQRLDFTSTVPLAFLWCWCDATRSLLVAENRNRKQIM